MVPGGAGELLEVCFLIGGGWRQERGFRGFAIDRF